MDRIQFRTNSEKLRILKANSFTPSTGRHRLQELLVFCAGYVLLVHSQCIIANYIKKITLITDKM